VRSPEQLSAVQEEAKLSVNSSNTEPNIDFVNLVMMLGTSAMVSLGEGVNPIAGKVSIDLAKARSAINMLVALKAKSQGNLNSAESKLLNDMVSDLEGKYVESMDLDEAVIKQLRKRPGKAAPKVKNAQDWAEMVRRKIEEQNEER